MSVQKRMILSFVLICVASVIMQLTLLHFKALKTQHYTPAGDSQQVPGQPGEVDGVVSSVSFDRFYLEVDHRTLAIHVPEGQPKPEVGSTVHVVYQSAPSLPDLVRFEPLIRKSR